MAIQIDGTACGSVPSPLHGCQKQRHYKRIRYRNQLQMQLIYDTWSAQHLNELNRPRPFHDSAAPRLPGIMKDVFPICGTCAQIATSSALSRSVRKALPVLVLDFSVALPA